MKTTTLLFTTIALGAAALLAACDKKEKTADDKTPPVITVLAPTDGSAYALGDTLYFEADIEDESELSDIQVNMIIGTDTTLLWPTTPTGFGNVTSYSIDQWIINTLPAVADATISFYAIDKHDNEATTNVAVQLTN